MFKLRRVYGASMEPGIKDRTLVLIAPFIRVKELDVVLIKKDKVEYIKRLQKVDKAGRIFLSADNFMGTDSRNWGWLSGSCLEGKVILKLGFGLRNSLKKLLGTYFQAL